MATTDPKMLALIARMKKLKAEKLSNDAQQVQELEKLPEPPVVLENKEIPSVAEAIAKVLDTATELARTQNFDKYGNLITYNERQQEFIDLVSSGKSCVLIGPAGTGKTTCMRGALQRLIESGKIRPLDTGTKCLSQRSPGLAVVAYTRRAVNNIRNNVSEDVKGNCVTVHKLLEYEPVFFEVADPRTGDIKKSMKFEPARDEHYPLPVSLSAIAFEESSMLGVDLYEKLVVATPHGVQEIFLGDIQQLPPIFGPAILGHKLLSLPVVELTEVYRQALESPILRLAHRILSGQVIEAKEFADWHFPGQLKLHQWKKTISPTAATVSVAAFFEKMEIEGKYDAEKDIILIPYNKECGTIEINKHIATHLAWKRNALVHEIVAGYNKHYLSVGDRVMFEKNDATILEIEENDSYSGKYFRAPSINYNYWGHRVGKKAENYKGDGDDAVDFLLSQVAIPGNEKEDRVQQASHRIKLLMTDSEQEIWIDKAAQINNLLLGYALTVHKAQGSEWRKVYLVLHSSHNRMLQRELLYTAVTRAKEELFVICEPDSFVKGIESQKIKGNTLEEKAEYFKGRYVLDNGGDE